MEVLTCCGVFSCSGRHAKLVALCKTESEQHVQTLTVFLPESKEVHQALCFFFKYEGTKLTTTSFQYNISKVLQA